VKDWSGTGWVSDEAVKFDLDIAKQTGTKVPDNLDLDKVRDFSIVKAVDAQLGVK
jgi:hypothetical protein